MMRAFATVCFFMLAGLCSASAAERPNVLVFLVDDLGQRDVGCYGSTFYETPNIDRLAKEGALFTNAYAACPVCSPTRASLLTGQYPVRSGITDYIGAAQPAGWNRNTKMLPAPYTERLALETPNLARVLKNAGYATFFAGKWHLGSEEFWPEHQGFDINKGGIDRGGPYGGKQYFSPYGNPRLDDGPPGEHLPDRLANETVSFIEANKDKPFFAYFSFYSVHAPHMSRADLKKKYEEKRAALGLKTEWGREFERDVRLTQDHAVYAGMVDAMDQAVGKVLAKVDELHLREKTVVIFTSDNGGLSTSEGWPTSNLPLRGGKGWMYEGGIREAFIVRYPPLVKAGSVVDAPISSPDLLPTCAELAGAPLPEGFKGDGLSLVGLLKGGTLPERPLFWHYPHYGNQGGAPSGAVRLGDWKLIEWYEDGTRELFNVATDIGETKDRAAEMPDKVKELAALLERWRNETGAKMPTTNAKFDPAKRSGRAADRVQPKKDAKGKDKAKETKEAKTEE
jgi:arylsulfatase A-like enzyme